MNSIWKRSLAMFLSIVMVFGMLPVNAFATDVECEHSYASKVTKEVTCEVAGETTYTCGLCGDVYTEEISATGHSWGEGVETAATCTEDGYTTYTCGNCGTTKTEGIIAATGHDMVDGACTVCGEPEETEDDSTEESSEAPAECNCEVKCNEQLNSDCPVCGAGDITACTGKEPEVEPEVDEQVVAVQAMIDALRTTINAGEEAEAQAEYDAVTVAIATLTDEQRAQLDMMNYDKAAVPTVIPVDEGADNEAATYADLVAALEAGQKEIKITGNFTIDTKINVPDGTTIDLNGCQLTLAVENSTFGDVTIKDSTDDEANHGIIFLAKDDVHVCDGYFLVNADKTLTLDNITVSTKADEGYKGYTVFHLYEKANLVIENKTSVFVTDNEYAGSIVYAGNADSEVTIDDSTVYGENCGRGFVYGNITLTDAYVKICGTEEGGLEHGFNRSTLTVKDSEVKIYGGSGRGITAETGDIIINGSSTVEITDMTEATIELRGNKSLSVADTATVTVDSPVNNTTAGTITGTVNDGTASTTYVAQVVGGEKYTDLQEAIKAAAPSGTVELLSDVTVDEWVMFSETLSISSGQIITIDIDGLTIDGKNHTLTIKDIESASNGNRLFYDATKLNIKDLTIEYVDAAANLGGICLTSGVISNVTFIGGCGVFPGTGDITITDCDFRTSSFAIYYEEARDNLTVTGNTFTLADDLNVILLRGNTTFTNNIINSGRTVNVVSGSPVVTGNNFNDVRVKVYEAATATISENKINNLVFENETVPTKSTFTDNTLSDAAQTALNKVTASAPAAYVAKIGEQGYETFAAAMNAANAMTGEVTVEIYGEVEFVDGMELKNGSYTSISFVGKDGGAKITINQTAGGDYLEAHGKTVSFTDLILAKANPAWSGNAGHMGNYFSVQGGTVTYTRCTFPNGASTNTGTATYNSCTFQNASEYGLWVYDDALVTVNGGTIDSKKGIKVYSEGEDSVTSTLTVEGATFTENVTEKPAVAIGYAESITLIGNTYNNTKGVLELDSGSDADCNGITFVAQDANGNDIASTLTAVDRSKSNAACGVLVDGKIYTTVAEAAKDANAGSTVTLLHNSTETVELAEGVILNKNNYTADGVTVAAPAPKTYEVSTKAELVDAISKAQPGETITLLNDIVYDGGTSLEINKAITLDLGGKTLTTYGTHGGLRLMGNVSLINGTLNHKGTVTAIKAWNVDKIEDVDIIVDFKEAGKTIGGIVVQNVATNRINTIKNVTITGEGLTNGIETYNCGDATEPVIGSMENVTIDAVGTAMNISAPCGTATNCSFNGGENGIEIWIKGTYSASLTLEDCDVTGGVYAHDEFSSDPTCQNVGSLTLTVDDATTGVETEDITLTIARIGDSQIKSDELIYVKQNAVAKIGDTYYMDLDKAVADAATGATITLLPDTHKLDTSFTNKELTFMGLEGEKANTVMWDAYNNYYQFHNTKFHFVNLTIDGEVTYGGNEGLHHSVEATYENCDIKGMRYLFCPTTFTNCDFDSTGKEHSFWTYGASEVTVTDCDFTYTDRAVNCYSENGPEFEQDITFTDCTFTYTGNADAPEGAVEINSSSVKSIDLTMNGCTGPAKGEMWFISQWDGKDGANTTVIEDDEQVWPVLPDVAQLEDANGNVIGTYKDFESALAAAIADETVTRIEILEDFEVTSVANTDDYYTIDRPLTIGAPEGEEYTVTVPHPIPGQRESLSLRVQGNGASLTIEENVTFVGLEIVANGFWTNNENLTIAGNIKASSLKQWTSNGTITISETGKVELGYGDGQFSFNYGNGTVNITGNGDKTAPQFKAGYSDTQSYGNGNTLNLKDTYFEGGAWFNLNGSNGTINADNALLKVSGGDGAGNLTIASSGNVINLTNGSELAVANLTIGAGNTVKLGTGSKITTSKITGAGTIEIDITGMTAGEVTTIVGDLSGFTGTVTATGNELLDAKIENGKLVLTEKPFEAQIGETKYLTLEAAVEKAASGNEIIILNDVTLEQTLILPADVTLNGGGKVIDGTIMAGGNLTIAGATTVGTFNPGWYNNTITIGEGASLKVTSGRMTVSYGNTFNITGSVNDAKTADKTTLTPSLELVAGISFNGDGGDVKFNVTNAYVKLGDSTTKPGGATGKFNMNFTSSIVDFTKTLKTYMPTGSGLVPEFNFTATDSVVDFASHLELWLDNTTMTLDKTNLTVGGSFANAGTVNVTNGANFVVKAPIMSTHGGNTGTINVTGGTFELADSNQDWENAGSITVSGNGKVITNDFKNVGAGELVLKSATATITGKADLGVTTDIEKATVKYDEATKTYSVELPDVAQVGDTKYKSIDEAIAAWTNNTTLTLLADVTLSDVIKLSSTEYHTLNLGTYTMTAAAGKHAIEITCNGQGTATYGLIVKADAENPGGITATGKSCIYYRKSGTTKDRVIIRVDGGVFNGSYAINVYSSNRGTNCPQVSINGGTFNGNVNIGHGKLIASGGTFNGWVNCTGDSTAYRQISGGRYKNWQFMTADASNKFWVGTSQANYNVGVYVDDEGYLVVGGPVITEAGETFEAVVNDNWANISQYQSHLHYLKYSSAAANGLYYTSTENALAANNRASSKITVYTESLDLSSINYKGTILIEDKLTVTFAEGTTPAWTVAAAEDGKEVSYTESVENGIVTRTYGVFVPVAQIGETKYPSVKAALEAAVDGDTITLIWAEGDDAIDMKGTVSGKTVTITGTADVDWSKGWLYVGRNGAADGTLIFDKANLTSVSNSREYGINVSGAKKDSSDTFNGTVILKDSTIVLDYMIQKNVLTLDNSTLTVNNGCGLAGRDASDSASGVDATATTTLSNGSKLILGNCNGMGLGYEGIGILDVDATSTFETTQAYQINAKGTLNLAGTAKIAGTLTNNGKVVLTNANATLTSNECGNVETNVADYKVVYADGAYKLVKKVYVAEIGATKYETLAEAAEDIATDGSDTTIKILTDIELSEIIKFNYGTGKVIFTAEKPVTVKQIKTGLDLDFTAADATNIVVDKNVTFEIYDNAAGMYLYYGPSLTVNGTITGGQNWGCLYLYDGEHTVSETGEISTGRVQLGHTEMTAKGEIDTNYLLVEGSTFTADGATVYANVIYDNNNGGQRWGASEFVIKNGANVTTSKLTLSYADSTLTIDLGSKLTATEIVGAGKIIIDAAGYTEGTACPIVGNASSFTGTIEVINNPDVYAVIDDNGSIVLKQRVYVAQIGENQKFETLAEAVTAVQDGETIELVENAIISEGTIKLPAALKNVTFKGAEGAVLKDMTIMAADGNSIDYQGLTFDGIIFDNSNIVITGWRNGTEIVKDLTVTNCEFKNVVRTGNQAAVHMNMDETTAVNGFTFTNNVIDGISGSNNSGIYGLVTGTVTIDKNVFKNVAYCPALLIPTTNDGIADTITFTNNTVSNSENGCLQISADEGTDTVKLAVTENIFKDIPNNWYYIFASSFAEGTEADFSKNYFEHAPMDNSKMFCYNDYTQNVEDLVEMGVFPYYADEAKTELVYAPTIMVTYADGSVEYFSDMLEAVPYTTNYDKLQGATIKLMEDITAKGIRFMETNMVLDLNGHTYTINNATGSSNTNTSGFQIREDAAKVTIKNGTINVAEPADMVVNTNVVWMFNSYSADFTVEDVTVDCTNMAWSYGESCYVHVSRPGDNTNFTGTTKIVGFDSTKAGNAINVGGTMTIAETADITGLTVELDVGATLTAKEGLTVVAPDGYGVKYENGVYSTIKYVAKIGDSYYATLAEALDAVGAGDVVIELLADAALDYEPGEAYGTAETTSLTIDGNGKKTLTLNQKDSDWSSIGLANADAKLVLNNMTIEKIGCGDTDGVWNTHSIIISNNVEMTDVTVNQSMTVENGATLNNVTIKEANGYYGLYITANGQTVTMTGGSITATNGGRGIKVIDQYADAPEQVTLTVDGTKFTTAEKAAVLVTSTAGAKITASNVDITGVEADSENFVWNDEERGAYYGKTEVTGGTLAQEAVEIFVASIGIDKKVEGYYKTLAEAIAAVSETQIVTLLQNSDVITELDKAITLVVTDNVTAKEIKLTNVNASITTEETDAMTTAVTCGVAEYKVAYEGGMYKLITVAVAEYNGTKYETVSEALNAARMSGGNVTVLRDCAETGYLVVPAGVTLELNGCVMTADYVIAIGQIQDSASTVGGIKAAKNSVILSSNVQMPLYDVDKGTYKFFDYSVEETGNKVSSNSVKFGYYVLFTNAEAYQLMSDHGSETGMSLTHSLTWTNNPAGNEMLFTYSDAHIKQYGTGRVGGKNIAFTYNVAGISAVSGQTLSATFTVTAGGVTSSDGQTYAVS